MQPDKADLEKDDVSRFLLLERLLFQLCLIVILLFFYLFAAVSHSLVGLGSKCQ